MGFERVWDSSCPRVWDQWEQNGRTWIVQDLAPEDDDEGVDMLVGHLSTDEPLSKASNVIDDPVSVKSIRQVWKKALSQRMSLGCYTYVDGKKTLVAMNAVCVSCKDDEELHMEGEALRNVQAVFKYLETRCVPFDHLGVDKFLNGLGLVVRREYRGFKLGGRLLAAREPLCRAYGIKGSSTVFSAPASQKLAAQTGYTTAIEVTWNQLADLGLKYPREDRVCKLMTKKYE